MTIPDNARYLLKGLNPSQAQAASALDGPLLILAGAGAGKTHTITRRAALLIATERCRPEQLLMVTFTNKAAREMRERLAGLLGPQVAGRIWAMTFHALCAQVLRRQPPPGYTQSFTILDASEARRALAKTAKQLGVTDPDAREKISKAKGSGQGRDGVSYELRALYDAYAAALREQNALDFDDLLLHGLAAMEHADSPWRERFAYVMVDETQDTSSGQARILRALAGAHKNLCVIGDDGQCQPGSTRVRTTSGDVRMDALDPTRHRLMRASEPHAAHGYPFTIAERHFTGTLMTVSGAGRTTEMTPGHRLPVRWTPASAGAHIVYLTRCGERWVTGYRTLAAAHTPRADETWVLSVHGTCADASAAARAVAGSYGIALDVSARHDDGLAERAERALRAHGRDPQFPLWDAGADDLPDRCAAANLLPELMQISVIDDDTLTGTWVDFTLERRLADTTVYSLEVAPHHTYIADGVLSHNSIYSWRGARVEFIRQFAQQWGATVVKLEENYRSSPQILAAANRLEAHSTTVMPKTLRPTRADGNGVTLRAFADSDHEASRVASQVKKLIEGGVAPDEIAIVYRANRVARDFEGALGRLGVRYQVWGGPSILERAIVRDVHCHLQLLFNGALASAWERAGGLRDGVGPGTINTLLTHAAQTGQHPAQVAASDVALPRVSARARDELRTLAQLLKDARKRVEAAGIDAGLEKIIDEIGIEQRLRSEPDMVAEESREALRAYRSLALPLRSVTGEPALRAFLENVALLEGGGQATDGQRVSLMTMHATKGLEFDHVLLVGLEEALFFPGGYEKDPEEERRLLYVGMTRARVNLHLSFAQRRRWWVSDGSGKNGLIFRDSEPLRFLRELGDTVRFVREDAPPRAAARTHTRSAAAGRRSGSRPQAANTPPAVRRRPPATRPQPIRYRTEQAVIHAQWGAGVVVAVHSERVRVRFASGERTILANATALAPA